MRQMIKAYPVTSILLASTTLVFLAIQLLRFGQTTSALTIYEFGGMFAPSIKAQPWQLWRLVAAIFVHIGWEHFAFNALTLYFIGRICEDLFGSARFLLLYLLSGVMGNLAVLVFSPTVVSAGASTSLFGLFAAVVIVGYWGCNPYVKQLGQSYLGLIVVNLIFNLLVPGISIPGHLGGIVGGAVLACALPTQVEGHLFQKRQRLTAWGVYGLLALGALFIGFL
ncbi:rhomboid family intramembrane serine protease [Streptococcus sp. DD12]|uniref:rhomboid family intramembrane serine protease n=1 Tax=Streptococcus sp. DD12 TaxID=1777880 RepID=UPI000797D5B7|nr:rhomboid family intramembrane serine protease [Streptococcus sp. DD12]KXT75464.1 GlpG protein (membrane protein of glp regulon) [Streptococcus sp. DD12]